MACVLCAIRRMASLAFCRSRFNAGCTDEPRYQTVFQYTYDTLLTKPAFAFVPPIAAWAKSQAVTKAIYAGEANGEAGARMHIAPKHTAALKP